MAAMQQQHSPSSDTWDGYEWNVPLDEIIDCAKCPKGCQTCYYKGKHAPRYYKAICVLVLLGFTIAMVAFIIRFAVYNSKRYTIGAGDEWLLGDEEEDGEDFSRLFCETLRVQTQSEQVTSEYVFTSKPRFLDEMDTFDIVENATVGDGLYPNWAYRLNTKGPHPDKVTVEACSSSTTYTMNFYFFCSKTDFQAFISSQESCTSCNCHKCSFNQCGTRVNSCQFSASKTQTYYMTLASSNSAPENVPVTFHFRRSRYDLSQAAVSCIQKSTCSTKLPLETTAIILTMPRNATINPSQLTTTCSPRLSMYFAFFFAVPVGIGLVIGSFAFLLMKLQQSVMKDVELADREREYRQMGHRANSTTSSPSVRGDTSGSSSSVDQRPLSPPPAYTNSAISININSGRVPLVESEQPVAKSLPDYDSIIAKVRSTTPEPPSYGSLVSS